MSQPAWLRRLVRIRPLRRGDRAATSGADDDGAFSRENVTCRRLEQRLRDSEERLRLALTAAKITSWEWRVDSGEVTVTGGMGAILGLAGPSGYLYPSHLANVHPDDRARIHAADRHAIEEGADYAVEFRVLAPDGTVRWLAEQGQVTDRDAAGRAVRVLGVVMDITARREIEERLSYQALHDPLTGLPNRARFSDRLEQALTRTEREGTPVAVLYLDLDGFKAINDRFGHDVGDRLLVAVAERLQDQAGAGATVARLGGDEFTILLDGADIEAASCIATRVIAALRTPFALAEGEAWIGVSVGIALSPPAATQPITLLREADVALYEAKAAGGSRFVVFAPYRPSVAASR